MTFVIVHILASVLFALALTIWIGAVTRPRIFIGVDFGPTGRMTVVAGEMRNGVILIYQTFTFSKTEGMKIKQGFYDPSLGRSWEED